MPVYEWKNVKTGETTEVLRSVEECHIPPWGSDPDSGEWERVFSVATKVEGGTTPARGSSSYGRKI